jgi:hypothetical protein
MELREFTMSSLEHAYLYCKVMRTRFQKYLSNHKATKSLQHRATRLAVFGQLTQETKFKSLRVTRMKYSHVRSIMKAILLLQDQKITLVAFGRISMHLKASKSHRLLVRLKRKSEQSMCILLLNKAYKCYQTY